MTPWTIGSSVHGISQARILEWVAIYIYIFFFRLFSIIGYYKILLIVHCAIPKVFISFICNSVYLLNPQLLIYSSLMMEQSLMMWLPW